MKQSRIYLDLYQQTLGWRKKHVIGFVTITPELAAELLSLNTDNRSLRQKLIDEYAKAMKNGLWTINGDSITISKTGVILNGQHRLHAVIVSGVSIVQTITSGLEDNVFPTIDNGRARSAGDALAISGNKNANIMAGAVKVIMATKNRHLNKDVKTRRYSNPEVVNFVENLKNKDLLDECCSVGSKCYTRAKFFSASTYGAFTYLFSEIDRSLALRFMDILTSGENISKTKHSSIYFLRKRLIDIQSTRYSLDMISKYALIIKAWNLFINNKEVGQLAWAQREEFPKIAKTSN